MKALNQSAAFLVNLSIQKSPVNNSMYFIQYNFLDDYLIQDMSGENQSARSKSPSVELMESKNTRELLQQIFL